MKKTKDKQKQKNILIANFFHRINPDAEGFDIFFETSKIQRHIAQSNKEKLEKEKEAEMTELKEKLKKQKLK